MQALNLIVPDSFSYGLPVIPSSVLSLPSINKESQKNLSGERIALYFKRIHDGTQRELDAWFAESAVRFLVRTGLSPVDGEDVDGVCFAVIPDGDITFEDDLECIPLRIVGKSTVIKMTRKEGNWVIREADSYAVPPVFRVGGLRLAHA